MKAILLSILLTLFLMSCSEKDEKLAETELVKIDTSKNISAPEKQPTLEDTITMIDDIVSKIEEKYKNKKLKEKIIKECENPGDDILALYYDKKELVKLNTGQCGEDTYVDINFYLSNNKPILLQFEIGAMVPDFEETTCNDKYYLDNDRIIKFYDKKNKKEIKAESKKFLEAQQKVIELLKNNKEHF